MKKILIYTILLLLVVPCGYCEEQLLQLTIESDKGMHELGEKINLTLILQNISDVDIYIDEDSSFISPIVEEANRIIKNIAIGDAEIISREAEAFVEIEPNKSLQYP